MEVLISQATQRNWDRLNVTAGNTKLQKRANKTKSGKRILPYEYFSNVENIPVIEQVFDEIGAYLSISLCRGR